MTLRSDNGQGAAQRAFAQRFVEPWARERDAGDMTFRLVPYDQLDRTVRLAGQRSTGVDVGEIDGPYVPTYAATGVLQPVTSQFDQADLDDFLPGVLDAAMIGDDFYGMSLTRSSQALLYNREVLDRYNITPPSDLEKAWTWPEALEAFRRVTEGERRRRGTDRYWAMQISNFGVPVGSYYCGQSICRSNGETGSPTFAAISKDGRKASGHIDSPEAIEALSFIRDLHQRYDLVPASTTPDLFARDRTAFYWTFPFELANVEKSSQAEIGVTPLPYFKTPVVNTQSFHWTVLKRAAHADAAIDWVGWLGRPEQIKAGAEVLGQAPSRRSVLDQLPQFGEGNQKVFTESLREWGVSAPRTAGFSDYAQRFNALLADVAGGADPAERARRGQPRRASSQHRRRPRSAAPTVPSTPGFVSDTRAPIPTASLRRAALLLAPTLALFAVFVVAPVVLAGVSSLRAHDFAGQPTGPLTDANYRVALRDDAFSNSMVLAGSFAAIKLPVQIALGLGAALLLAGNNRLNRLTRSAVTLPSFVAIAVVGYLFSYIFSTDAGLVNLLLETVGVSSVPWLQDGTGAQAVVLLTSLWRDTGIVMLVFLAGLAAVPSTLIEAVKVDGATPWQTLRLVVLPLLQRSFQFAAVLTTILSVQLVVPVLLLTQGGPRDATSIAPYELYERAFVQFDWGPASAMAVLFLACVLALTLVEMWLLRSRWQW